jgi:hypothetical protein
LKELLPVIPGNLMEYSTTPRAQFDADDTGLEASVAGLRIAAESTGGDRAPAYEDDFVPAHEDHDGVLTATVAADGAGPIIFSYRCGAAVLHVVLTSTGGHWADTWDRLASRAETLVCCAPDGPVTIISDGRLVQFAVAKKGASGSGSMEFALPAPACRRAFAAVAAQVRAYEAAPPSVTDPGGVIVLTDDEEGEESETDTAGPYGLRSRR